ncbi:MAG: hypothetical protein OEZ39_00765 [Gammaproteobacteria bacterium]|nr:hypothetical protein [Gammaproteobacteria bacterium]MDH5650381.1 hypothetical protein [Gammaproteobacteria bacterium]
MEWTYRVAIAIVLFLANNFSHAALTNEEISKYLTGNWHGKLYGKKIEIAIWPPSKEILFLNTNMVAGYLYSPADDCFTEIAFVLVGTFSISELKQVTGKHPNCASLSRGNGTFSINDKKQILDIAINSINAGNFSSANANVSLRRAALSREMEKFLVSFRPKWYRPKEEDLALLKRQGKSKNSGFAPSADVQENKYSTKNGLIVRPLEYWVRFSTPEFRNIFEGDFTNANDNVIFMLTYYGYQNWFSNKCPHLIPEGSPSRTFIREEYYGNDLFPSRTINEGKVFVRREYWNKYQELSRQAGELIAKTGLAQMRSAMSGQRPSLSDIIKYPKEIGGQVFGIGADLAIIFAQETCESGFNRQFSENLRRFAYGMPVLQKVNNRHFDYSKHDSGLRNALIKSIASTCTTYYADNSAMNNSDLLRWCKCIGDRLTPTMKAEDKKEVISKPKTLDWIVRGGYEFNDPKYRYTLEVEKCRR